MCIRDSTCTVTMPGVDPPSPLRFRLLMRHTDTPMIIMWDVFVWWIYVAVTHWGCVCAHIQQVAIAALGICGVVGTTLNVSAYSMWRDVQPLSADTSLWSYLQSAPFATMRFFLVPFCVASYSGVINQESELGTFQYLFPSKNQDGHTVIDGVNDTVTGVGLVLLVTILALVVRHVTQRHMTALTTQMPAKASQGLLTQVGESAV
eukprot:TRINITY_DN3705_c0_g1_i1.p1 TRINITY_DN3705_c0_g1~~TRINITY_DN3705_c0_g1_i1.p1  ORF type:complete len:205 (-),score=28.05 TRINITY_DN3705_c0_g1_i1:201-815(-)